MGKDKLFKSKNIKFNVPVNEDFDLNWSGEDYHKSRFIDVIAFLLPHGEDFFIKVIKDWRSQITDPDIKKQANLFCGQEANHATEHYKYNAVLLKKYPKICQVLEKIVVFIFNTLILKWFGRKCALAAVAAAEHITTLLAVELLKDPPRFLQDNHALSSMLYWHVVEEVEHKAVAHDVYQHVCGGYFKRCTMYVLLVSMLILSLSINHIVMAYADKKLSWSTWGQTFSLYWSKTYRDGRKGLFRLAYRRLFAYFKPGFHPDQEEDDYLINEWMEQYKAGNSMSSVSF